MTKSHDIMKLNRRLKQAYAALCLDTFCKNYEIGDPAVRLLIIHLLGMLTSSNLTDWERAGAALELTGRGDPLPPSFSEQHPANVLDDLRHLTELCVEVGLVDMYGGCTDQPDRFLSACISFLEHRGIQTPALEPLTKLQSASDGWGSPMSEAEFRSFLGSIDPFKLTS